MKTLREQYIAALEKIGEKRVKTTFHYTVFTRTKNIVPGYPLAQYDLFYYIGASGAVRVGRSIATSSPLPDMAKARLRAIAGGPAGVTSDELA